MRKIERSFVLGAALLAPLSYAQQQAPAAVAVATQPVAASSHAAVSPGGVPAPAPRAASMVALSGNVVTVEELIKIENEMALEKARQARVAAGLGKADQPTGSRNSKPAAMTVTVESIYGSEGSLRVDLTANGQRYEGVRAGARVASCEIESIVGRRVAFKPAEKGVTEKMCPTASWSGITTPASMSGFAGLAQPGADVPPLPSGGFLPPVAPPNAAAPAVRPPSGPSAAVPTAARSVR